LSAFVIASCAPHSLPLSVVMVFTPSAFVIASCAPHSLPLSVVMVFTPVPL